MAKKNDEKKNGYVPISASARNAPDVIE